MMADSHHFDEEQDPDQNQKQKSDPDPPQWKKRDPLMRIRNNEKRD